MAKNVLADPTTTSPSRDLALRQREFDRFLNDAQRGNRLVWLHFRAPWNAHAEAWDRDVFARPVFAKLQSEFAYFEWDADLWPELDNAAQVLVQSLAGRSSGWPLHLFLEPRTLKPLIGMSALQADSFEAFLRDLLISNVTNRGQLPGEAERNWAESEMRDPLKAAPDETSLPAREIESAFLTPLSQSIDYESGLFGTRVSFLHPAAYGALLGLPELGLTDAPGPNPGEVALTQLGRGPVYDVIGGGFFRSLDWVSGDVETEKLLHQNAEMLWVLSDAVLMTRSPFLTQLAGETMRCMLEDFFDAAAGRLHGALRADVAAYAFDSSDLIEALAGIERAPAQRFFGITGSRAIPRIRDELATLSRELAIAPVDLKNLLVEAQKKLRLFRQLRTKVGTVEAARWQECFAVAAMLRARRIAPGAEASVANDGGRGEAIGSRLGELAARLESSLQRSPPAPGGRDEACAWLLRLERARAMPSDGATPELAGFIATLDARPALPIFGARLELFDHLGWSASTLKLLVVSTHLEIHRSIGEAEAKRVGAFLRGALFAARRLGLNAFSSFWSYRNLRLHLDPTVFEEYERPSL